MLERLKSLASRDWWVIRDFDAGTASSMYQQDLDLGCDRVAPG